MELSDEEGQILPEFVDEVSLLCEDLTKELPTHHQQDAVDNMTSDDDSKTNLQFDLVCSICDDGGYVLCCDGTCLRSFHPTIADGIESACESLGFTDKTHVQELGTYLCNNCLYKQHQCYACGKLGSSDEESSQQVFPCSASNCGHFYHPECVARLLCPDDHIKSEELQAKIAARDSFACPLHMCKVCNLTEDKNQYPLHFAVCRRCPTAYHRKCLPVEITSELNCYEDRVQRAWERMLPYNRILIYCLAHEIDGNILTPARDHLVFPDISGPRRTQSHEVEDASSIDVKTVEESVMEIIDEVDSSFNFEEFAKSRGATSGKSYHSGYDISKNITTGLVQTHCDAARAALKMFEEGRDEEAKAIFDPHILLELMRHKTELETYLSPFLDTSHGRHFTKKEKLEEVNYNADLHNVEISQGDDDNGMVQDMDISPAEGDDDNGMVQDMDISPAD